MRKVPFPSSEEKGWTQAVITHGDSVHAMGGAGDRGVGSAHSTHGGHQGAANNTPWRKEGHSARASSEMCLPRNE